MDQLLDESPCSRGLNFSTVGCAPKRIQNIFSFPAVRQDLCGLAYTNAAVLRSYEQNVQMYAGLL